MAFNFSSTIASVPLEKAPPAPVVAAYSFFVAAAGGMYFFVSGADPFSAVMTVAEMFTCLAVLLLTAQVLYTRSANGVSAKAIGLEAVALCCRLSSTLWLQGYLPVDESGDWFFQGVDICALLACVFLLYQVVVVHKDTYQDEDDTFPVTPAILISAALAILLHANMNLRPVFDSLWMMGLFVGTVAVLPQLWLIMRNGGQVEALMSHNIAAMCVGRLLGGVFFYLARQDITCDPWVNGVNHSVLAILGAHLLHLLLLGDFAYIYLKALATQGLMCRLDLDVLSGFV